MTSVLLNILLQLIEALIAYYFYEKLSPEKGKTRNLFLVLAGYAFTTAANLLFDYNVVINTSLLFVSNLLFAKVLYKNKTIASVFYALIFTSGVAISEIGVVQLLSALFGNSFGGFKDNVAEYILLIVLSKSILFFVLAFLSSILNNINEHKKIDFVYFIYPFSLVIIVIIFNIISYKYDFSNDSKILVAGSSLFLIFSVILTCIHQQAELQRKDELAELREEAREREVNKAYFDLIEKQNSEMQIFAHDINNHLQNIYSLSGSEEEAKKYIKMLSNDIKDTGKYGKSPNKLLDLIVGKYEYLCKKEDIAFETNIHYFNLSFIDENDVASLLNNLLDNALEASRKSKTKEVSLGVNKIEQMVFIDVTNSCDSSPNIKNGFPVTTKKDTGLHGYGFKSIMRTVKKYNGDLDWNYDKNDHIFTVSILFKIT